MATLSMVLKLEQWGAEKSEVNHAWATTVLEWVRHDVSRMGDVAFLEFAPRGSIVLFQCLLLEASSWILGVA